MPAPVFDFVKPFLREKKARDITIIPVTKETLASWLKNQSKPLVKTVEDAGFNASPGQCLLIRSADGQAEKMVVGVHRPLRYHDLAAAADFAARCFSSKILDSTSFSLYAHGLSEQEQTRAAIGWGWGCYHFSVYKKDKKHKPSLVWPKKADKTRVRALIEGVDLARNLINTPPNDMGPEELELAARTLARLYKAKIRVLADKQLLKEKLNLLYAVGDSSPRRPRLIDLTWGNAAHPKVTIIGKGVVFDTGGLFLKPPQHMKLMKKDMGGAAHALGLALAIMKLKLPVRLRVLLAAAENAISATAFRPSDVIPTRKGLTVEINDTDAEGRLVVADALTLACEENPDLVVDFTTLTGSARSALGYEIPAFFSNREDLLDKVRKMAMAEDDPLWPLPLWQPYLKEMDSEVADISNIGTGLAGAIHGALFLQQFLSGDCDWLHLDMFAWEASGKPGRPKGGADTGLRAILAYIEKRFA